MSREVENFNRLVDSMKEMHKGKNDMYGSSFERLLEEHGHLAGLIPLKNKLHRIESLVNLLKMKNDPQNEADLKDALEDSLLDLGTYAYKWASYEREHRRGLFVEPFDNSIQNATITDLDISKGFKYPPTPKSLKEDADHHE